MQKRQVFLNAGMSILQVIVIGVTLFILYRFLLSTIGVEQLGIWSLVVAVASVTQIANFGLSGSVVKFVAKYVAHGDLKNVSSVIQTASLSVGVLVAVILLASYPVIHLLIGFVVPLEALHLAQSLLPFAIFAFWIMVMTSVFQAGLDGFQRIDLRTLLLMGGTIFNLVLCFILVPIYGLKGIAYSLVIQNLSVFVGSWVMLKKLLPGIPLVPNKWSKPIFKEIVGYGVNFQLISATTMLYDPITKALLTKFGGLALTGYFEMASKMVQQFRAIIVSANQVLVPAIANMKEKNPEKIRDVYLLSYRLIYYLATPLFSLIIVSTHYISAIWIGHFEFDFILFSIILSIGWFLNTLNAPSYFAYLGIGYLRWNVVGHVVIAILNVSLGFLGGIYFGGIGVVICWAVSLVIGSSIIYLTFHKKYSIPISLFVPSDSVWLSFICFVCVLFNIVIEYQFPGFFEFGRVRIIFFFLNVLLIFIMVWIHPLRSQLTKWVKEDFIKKGRNT